MSTAFQISGLPKKLTIRIELIGIQPAIWREIEVPSNISADELAYVLELVMGWSGSHLPAFMVRKQEYMLSEDCIDGIEDFALPYDDMTASDLAFFRQHGICPWFADDEKNSEYFD